MPTDIDRKILMLCLILTAFIIGCQSNIATRNILTTLESVDSGIDFVNDVADSEDFNIIKYLYHYNGGGVACADLNGDDLPDLFFTANQESNALYINQGDLRFERDSFFADKSTGNWTTGVTIIDINGDGLKDIYVCQVSGHQKMSGRNALYLNEGMTADGGLNFIERAKDVGLDYSGLSTQAVFLDFDLDNDLDMYLLCHSVHSTETYRDTSLTREPHPRGDKFFRNVGSFSEPKFVDASSEVGILSGVAGYGLGVVVGDFNQDRYPDLYISNDFHESDFLYINTGQGSFVEVISMATGHTSTFSMGCDAADINNDGWLDILSLDMKPMSEPIRRSTVGEDTYEIQRFKNSFGYHNQLPRNCLQLNEGLDQHGYPRFAEVAQLLSVDATEWSWSGLILDLDLNGMQDIFITNGISRRPNDLDYLKYIANAQVQEEASDLQLLAQMPPGITANQYFLQERGLFEQYSIGQSGTSQGAIYSDLDLDGDLDLVINNMNSQASLLKNTSSQDGSTQFIVVKPISSLAPILGTKVWVHHGSSIQFREVQNVRGWLSSVEATAHFGLGESLVDSIVINHPTLGSVSVMNPEINSILKIDLDSLNRHPSSVDLTEFPAEGFQNNAVFEHQENEFYDYNREPLIPRLLSREGPALAVGDLDSDGIDEIFIGGAAGQSGVILKHIDSSWIAVSNLPSTEEYEDVTACMLDVDNDQDLDLFVGSAGFQAIRQDSLLLDRLYINDGTGQLTLASDALPSYFIQTSAVDHSDIDRDGDQDILVTGRGLPFGYGRPCSAYLLRNDGSGTFYIDSNFQKNFADFGMITDVTLADVDGDLDKDLISVGEWEPPRILHNDGGVFIRQESDLDQLTGWWECVDAVDLDRDGDMDLILGNLGANHSLMQDDDDPKVKLYINDFDANLTNEIVLTTQHNGEDSPLASFAELSQVLPFLSKKFRTHQDYSHSSMEDIFGPKLSQSIVKEANFFNSVIAWNDGLGNFSVKILPAMAQQSTVAAAIELASTNTGTQVLLAGNFHHFRPDIGRQDASYGILLSINREREIIVDAFPQKLTGEIRNLDIAQGTDGQYLVIAKNDDWIEIIRVGSVL